MSSHPSRKGVSDQTLKGLLREVFIFLILVFLLTDHLTDLKAHKLVKTKFKARTKHIIKQMQHILRFTYMCRKARGCFVFGMLLCPAASCRHSRSVHVFGPRLALTRLVSGKRQPTMPPFKMAAKEPQDSRSWPKMASIQPEIVPRWIPN